jgi:iron complex outermembrane receptor protein
MGGATVATAGTISNWSPIIRNDYNTRDDWLFSAGLNNEFKINDELSLLTDLSYSRNRRVEHITETYAGYGCCVTAPNQGANREFDSLTWELDDGFPEFHPGLNYADANQVSLGDRDAWGGWGHDGATKAPHVKEKIYAADGGLRWKPTNDGPIQVVDVGANFTRRDKDKYVDEYFLFLKNDRLQTLVDSDILVAPTNLDFVGFGPVLSYNVNEAMDRYYDFGPTVDSAHFDKTWAIQEDILTLKARAQFALGELHGNVGIQAVRQKQESTGSRINFTADPPIVEPVKEGDSYWDILPSLNAYYDFGGGHRLRFAAAKVMARPRMDEMRANLVPSFNTNPCGSGGCDPDEPPLEVWSANGGNPRLKPWRAKALDVSYEWYIGPASYIAVAGFYKKLDNYIFTRVSKFDFASFPMPDFENPLPPGVDVTTEGDLSMPDNGPGGKIYGLEVSGALELGRLASFLDGFGVQGSYSKTKSNLNPVDPSPGNPNPEVRIPGLSGTVYNLTGYFEKHGFQARISYRYRSAFKGEVVQLFAVRGFTEILADKQVDGQIGYTFPENSRFGNLGVLLQAYNLTNSPYRTRVGLDESGKTPEGGLLIDYYEKYGRQFLFGVNYKF